MTLMPGIVTKNPPLLTLRERSLASLLGGVGVGSVHGKPLSFFRAHWDHEPDLHKSLNDE